MKKVPEMKHEQPQNLPETQFKYSIVFANKDIKDLTKKDKLHFFKNYITSDAAAKDMPRAIEEAKKLGYEKVHILYE